MHGNDELRTGHNVTVELFGSDGELKERHEIHNAVVTVGKNAIADQLLEEPAKAKPSHMAIGKSGTEVKAEDTKLKEELDRNKLASKTRKDNVVTVVGEWLAGDGTGELREAGIFNASSEGDLYARTVFGVITKEALDVLKITWEITIG